MSATGLKAADRNGLSDLYVKLALAGQRAKSKTIMATLDPQWDAHFEFTGVRGELLRHNLRLSVFDWDRLTTDDKLGSAYIDLEPLLHKEEHAVEAEQSEQGRVRLRLRWVAQSQLTSLVPVLCNATNDLEAALLVTSMGARKEQQPLKGAGKVYVHLLRGEGFKAAGKKRNFAPFVKLSLGKQTLTSKTITKTLEPRWNANFEFESKRSVLASSPLKLSMFDRDPLTSLYGNTSLGSASVDLSPLMSSLTFWSSRKYYTVERVELQPRRSREAERP